MKGEKGGPLIDQDQWQYPKGGVLVFGEGDTRYSWHEPQADSASTYRICQFKYSLINN